MNNWNKRGVATYPSHPPEKKDFCRPFLLNPPAPLLSNTDFLMLCRLRAADMARARGLRFHSLIASFAAFIYTWVVSDHILRAGTNDCVRNTEFLRKWVAQCEAAKQIKQRFGTGNALEYLVGEKRLGFIEAADRYAEFAQELPHFLDGIRGVFILEETGDYVDQLELTCPLSPPQRRALRTISSISSYIH